MFPYKSQFFIDSSIEIPVLYRYSDRNPHFFTGDPSKTLRFFNTDEVCRSPVRRWIPGWSFLTCLAGNGIGYFPWEIVIGKVIWVYIYIYTHIHISTCIYIYISNHIYIYICTYCIWKTMGKLTIAP